MTSHKQREFNFTKQEFQFLTELVLERTGIVLKENKFEMVYSRLARRIRKLGLNKFQDYISILKNDKSEEELAFLVDAITTNLTKFFRESHQFKDFISNVLDKKILSVKKGALKKIRIWSAGCSGGQEAYSIAMIIASYMKDYKDWDILILATDIDRTMLNKGKKGIYSSEEVDSLPEKFTKKYIRKRKDKKYDIDPELQQMVKFKYLNLLHEWPLQNLFDVIFCRNVVIYFDGETKNDLVNRFSDKIQSDGMLYLGHSEARIGENKNLKAVGRASFQRVTR